MEKPGLIAQLRKEAEEIYLNACNPYTKMVWGEGNLDAKLVIVGEAPGFEEDCQQRPFVGVSGKLLDRELKRAGINRNMIYITNAVKCRPVQVNATRHKNRRPSVAEIKAWHAILARELKIIQPQVILCLGVTAASILIHPKFAIVIEHGRWFDGPYSTRTMATYHPAYINRSGTKVLNEFQIDLKSVVDEL